MLMEYLRTEIFQAQSDRAPLEARWNKYLLGYRAFPENETKDFPFVGAANLVLPVIATDVDTVFSRMMGILFASENLWSCKALNDRMVPYAPRLQEFLQWAQNAELNIYPALADWLIELCKLGTGILKTRYTRESKRVYQFRETDQGTIEQIAQILIRDHPVVNHTSLFNFLLPASALDIQAAPWCSERLDMYWGQIQNRVAAGIYQTGKIQSWWAKDKGARQEELMQQMDAFRPGVGDKITVHESWLDFDISGIGEPMAIVATVHLPSMSLLRVDYNPFLNQEKPFSDAKYLRQEKRFYGIGLCEMLDQFQDEISTMHNQRIDNSTLLNSAMFKARKGIGIKQDEPVFPGRWFLLDDLNDVQPMVMGQKYDSTVPNETLSLNYARGRTGVTDYISGASDNPSIGYGAATTAIQQLREGTKRFDQVLREARRCLGSVGTQVVELYQQFDQHGKEYQAMGAKDGAIVHQILQFPLDLIRTSIGVELTATSANLNKEVEIRTNQIIMQMIMQFYQQIMQGVSYMVNPQMPPEIRQLAGEMVQGGTILMRRILDSYGVQDADALVPTLGGMIQNGNQQLSALANAAGGGPPQPALPPGAPGMANGGGGYPGANPGFNGPVAA